MKVRDLPKERLDKLSKLFNESRRAEFLKCWGNAEIDHAIGVWDKYGDKYAKEIVEILKKEV